MDFGWFFGASMHVASWRPRPNKSDFGGPLGLILGGFWEVFDRFLADVH